MITEEEYRLINAYAADVKARAAAKGLTLEYSSDPQAFADFLGRQEFSHGVSSVHDPRKSDILRREFGWLLASHAGLGVCCHAIRLFETDDFMSDVLAGRLYGDIEIPDEWHDPELYPQARELRLSGRIAFGGGLWVHPDWRGQDLSGLLRKVLRVVNLPRLRWDHYCSTYRNTPNRREWGRGDGWTPHIVPLSHGYYRPYGSQLDVILAYASRAETLDILRSEVHD